MAICGNEGNDKGCCCCMDSSYGILILGMWYCLALIGTVGEYFGTRNINSQGSYYNGAIGTYVWVNREDGYEY